MNLKDVPPWVWIVGGIVALLALMSRASSGGGGGSYGEVTAYSPVPVDQGIIALESAKLGAKEHAFESVVGLFGARDVAARDVTVAQLSAGVENNRTAAQLNAANYRTEAERAVGFEQARTAATIVKTNADSALALSRDQGATAKSVAKTEARKDIVKTVGNTITNVVKGIGKLFGF